MIEINLLPKEFRTAQKKQQKKPEIKLTVSKATVHKAVIGAISLFLACTLFLAFFAFIQQRRLVHLGKQLKAISSDEEVATALKRELDSLSSRLTLIDSLSSSSLLWSKKLYNLNRSVTDGVWLNSLYLDVEIPEGQQKPVIDYTAKEIKTVPQAAALPQQMLVLKGSAVSPTPGEETAIVGKFMESLKNNADFFSDFDDVKLTSIQRKQMGDIEVMDFAIICYFKQGRSYFEKLERRDK